MLLAVWYDLSDVKLADAFEDPASFRRFCGFSGTEATPERTAFVRFRRMLVARYLDRALFDAVTIQLNAKAIRVKAGTIVDATIIASASEDDGDGRWVKHRGKRATPGFKAHVACDADTALVERIAVTPANVNDGRTGPDALSDCPGEVLVNSSYRGPHFGGAVRAKGGTPRVVLNAMWGREEEETLGRLSSTSSSLPWRSLRPTSDARVPWATDDFAWTGGYHPIRSSWAIPRASFRSVFTVIADSAAFT